MVFDLLNVIPSAGGESPLAPESPVSETLKLLLPLNTLALGYLAKVFKEMKQGSSDTHSQIIRDIAEGKEKIDASRQEISKVRHDVRDLRQELIAAGYLKGQQ